MNPSYIFGFSAIFVIAVLKVLVRRRNNITNTETEDFLAELVVQAKPKKILFVKTHKTGSSTLQNILFRYSEKYDQDFVFSRTEHHFLGYPKKFVADFVHPSAVNNRIIAQHLRYSKELEDFFDRGEEKTVKFTILRNPCGFLPSAYNYRLESL